MFLVQINTHYIPIDGSFDAQHGIRFRLKKENNESEAKAKHYRYFPDSCRESHDQPYNHHQSPLFPHLHYLIMIVSLCITLQLTVTLLSHVIAILHRHQEFLVVDFLVSVGVDV